MTSPARYQPIATPPAQRTNISQATAIEQSRAVAEVQAAVLVAQQNRRDKSIAVAEMRDATAQTYVAERAFFRFPRGGQTVSGPSVHLARELARCWGNIQFGVTELRRDDDKGESEMQAYAWDLETNARNSTTFIVPHKRDTKKGVVPLADMRDIYENNANNGARRLREAIFAVLPGWFVDEAQDRCTETLNGGGGVPLAQRIANSIGAFEKIGVTRQQLESKIGRPSGEWTEHDVTELGVAFKSIRAGEVTKEDEFPPARVTAAEISSSTERKTSTRRKKDPEVPAEPPVELATEEQIVDLAKAIADDGITDPSEAVKWVAETVKQPGIEKLEDLTRDQAQWLLNGFAQDGGAA
jgi:hypothetical protein